MQIISASKENYQSQEPPTRNVEILLQNVVKKFGDKEILSDITLPIYSQTIHGLLGPNGVGKTTTLRLMAGTLLPTSGRVYVREIDTIEDTFNASQNVGILLEKLPLYEELKVTEYLSFVASIQGINKKEIHNSLEKVIEQFSLNSVAHRTIRHLSRGFKQRVGLAQAIIHNPPIIILDEPTTGLDPESIYQIRNLILDLKKNHTVVLSSHHLSEISLICDRVSILHQGIFQTIESLDSFEEYRHKKRNFFIELHNQDSSQDKLKNHVASLMENLNYINNFKFLSAHEISRDSQVFINPNNLLLMIETTDLIDHRIDVIKFLTSNEISFLSIFQERKSLEKFFLESIKNDTQTDDLKG
jgi:ABC-2 type transport system ATP-binding protein